MKPEAPRWHVLDVVLAVLATWAAAVVRGRSVGWMELPPDGATMLHRSLDLRDGVDLPLLGNTVVGWPFHFGVFPDWVRGVWMLGADTLLEASRQVATSHALIAAWAYLLCARLGARGAGVLLAAVVALDPQVVSAAFAYPVDYRTAEWGLLLALGVVLVSERHPDRSPVGTAALVVACALIVTTHPFAAAALLPAGIALLRWGAWPGWRLAGVAALLVGVIAGPWARDVVRGLGPFLGQSFDAAGRSTGVVFPVDMLRAWWGGIEGLVDGPVDPGLPSDPGVGWVLPLVLGLGLVGALVVPRARSLLLVWLGWSAALLGLFAVAGFAPKRYHLVPPMTVGLAAALVGLELGLRELLGRWPRTKEVAPRAALGAMVALLVALAVGPFGARWGRLAADVGPRGPLGVAAEADHLGALALGMLDGEPGFWLYAFFELRHQGLGEGVPVAMRLMTGERNAGRVVDGRPVVGILSRRGHLDVPAFHVEKVVLVSKGEWVHVGRLDSLEQWPEVCRALDALEPEPLGIAGVHANAVLGERCGE